MKDLLEKSSNAGRETGGGPGPAGSPWRLQQARVSGTQICSSAYYQTPRDWHAYDTEVIEALNQLVGAHPRWGVWKSIARLRAMGPPWNHKRIDRVYRQLGLTHPRRTNRRLPKRPALSVFVPEGPNEVWSAAFLSDAL